MKLINCYIENFGTIKETEISFSDGITEFCRENGYGKTTLATFLKAMFYGLPAARKNQKFNDRMHFYPFHGGKFGGSLTFEKGGKQYRIERFFDKGSGVKDTFVVYCGGTQTEEFGPEIGKELFGLDEEAFARTIFITAEQITMRSNGSINAKLNNYVDHTDEVNNFDAAKEILDKARKNLKADRGNGGLISGQRETIRELNLQIENLNRISDALGGKYERSEELRKEIAGLEAQEKQIRDRNLLLEKWKGYDRLVADSQKARQNRDVLLKQYPQGIPTTGKTEQMQEAWRQMTVLRANREAAAFDAGKQNRLEELAGIFAEGYPDDIRLEQEETRNFDIEKLSYEIGSLQAQTPAERQRKLAERFGGRAPSDEVKRNIEKHVRAYQEAEAAWRGAEHQTEETAVQRTEPRKGGKLLVFGVFAAVLLIVGGIFTLGTQTQVGVILLTAGVLLLCGTGFYYILGRVRAVTAVRPDRVDENLLQLRQQMEESRMLVKQLLVPYGYEVQNVETDAAFFRKDAEEYEEFLRHTEETEVILQEKEAVCLQLKAEAVAFLKQYRLPADDFSRELQKLRSMRDEYLRLSREEKEAREKREQYTEQYQARLEDIQGILSAYGLELLPDLEGQLKRLETDRSECDRLKRSADEAEKEAENCKQKEGLSVRPDGTVSDLQEVEEQLTALRRQSAQIEREIAEDERELEKLEEKQNQLALAEETLEAYKKKFWIYQETLDALKTAEETLKEKYVAPVKTRFQHYADRIEAALGEKITMDRDFRISFERGGEKRSDGHLSAGQYTACALCFRLALIDNLYETEQPFIIMDDPFVNLDAQHMENVMKLVRLLAKEKQIIYFCCHESRKLG